MATGLTGRLEKKRLDWRSVDLSPGFENVNLINLCSTRYFLQFRIQLLSYKICTQRSRWKKANPGSYSHSPAQPAVPTRPALSPPPARPEEMLQTLECFFIPAWDRLLSSLETDSSFGVFPSPLSQGALIIFPSMLKYFTSLWLFV